MQRWNVFQYSTDVPPRFVRSCPQQEQYHQQQQQHSYKHHSIHQQYNSQQWTHYSHHGNKSQWNSQEKRRGTWNTQRIPRRGKQRMSDPEEQWEFKRYRNSSKQNAWSGGSCKWTSDQRDWPVGMEWLDGSDPSREGSCEMGIPYRSSFFLMPTTHWGNDIHSWQYLDKSSTPSDNVSVMDIPWLASDFTKSPFRESQQLEWQQQWHEATTSESCTSEQIRVSRMPATTVCSNTSGTSIPTGFQNHHQILSCFSNQQQLFSSDEGCKGYSNQQEEQLEQCNYQYPKQSQLPYEQSSATWEQSSWAVSDLSSWEWSQTDNLWVFEPTTTGDSSSLPVWGSSVSLLPLVSPCHHAVATNPAFVLSTAESSQSNSSFTEVGHIPTPYFISLHSAEHEE